MLSRIKIVLFLSLAVAAGTGAFGGPAGAERAPAARARPAPAREQAALVRAELVAAALANLKVTRLAQELKTARTGDGDDKRLAMEMGRQKDAY